MRPDEIEGISLRHSAICKQTDKVDLRLQPKTKDNKYGALWRNEDITIPAKRSQIQLRLKKLLDLMGHARNSKSSKDYYVFAERLKDNEIATKLSDTRGQVECNPISNTQQSIYVSYTSVITSPLNLREMPSCNFDKQVSELLTTVSNKLVSIRCQQTFMGGYAHAVR
ncbi:MAG: hypothetical protein EZS28_027717 [Streblomastix strix]|uniref:Uncharacterized protein n=1 Tax=Streblomastix strix TaxID=222440 RepID=A0A5J4V225_9EUKA|nr:MAG: hypothetical protein EZS28_027717 [Streblomastix strix]